MSRSRVRVGRAVFYNPTDAEAAAQGDGPWPARIVGVNADGSVELIVHAPTDAATVPAVASADADGTYGAAEATLINELKTVTNLLRDALLGARKSDVALGSGGGTFAFEAPFA